MSNWGYASENGPDKWHKEFPVALEGKRQSPVDLNPETAVVDKTLKKSPFEYTYDPKNTLNVENTGASWKVNVDGKGSKLTGGPLGTDEYELWQFHAHWGCSDERGSEHTINGKRFPAELHLVHWNRTKYASPNDAAGEDDGLAVLGMFMEIGEQHEELEKLCNILHEVRHKGEKVNMKEPLDPAKLLPKDTTGYYTYEGSLTTPPLLESVIWTVFKEPIKISMEQLNEMRGMFICTKECKDNEPNPMMVDNFRPPVPLGERVLRQC